jgi:hypothetical protein
VVVVGQDCRGSSGDLTVSRFDAQARPLASQRYDAFACASAVATGDASGNTLVVLWPGNAVGLGADDFAARWFGPDANATTGWFSAGRGASSRPAVVLRPLAAGGAALQVDGNWTATFRSGVGSADAAFPWLQPQFDLITIRQGRGYALIPRGSNARDVLRLVSASGKSCADVRFSTQGLSVAPDGTVIGSQGDGGCTHPFWPGLLR